MEPIFDFTLYSLSIFALSWRFCLLGREELLEKLPIESGDWHSAAHIRYTSPMLVSPLALSSPDAYC